MHDHFFIQARMVQELVADPDQVLRPLLFERDARPDAGMAEEEIPEGG